MAKYMEKHKEVYKRVKCFFRIIFVAQNDISGAEKGVNGSWYMQRKRFETMSLVLFTQHTISL